jgi:hypothetical protein
LIFVVISNRRIQREWHSPPVELPTTVTAENLQNYSNQTNSDRDRTDSRFEQNMSANLRATITRPNTNAILAVDTISTDNSYDPIDELDAIIDNEDLTTTFHDSLDEFFENNGMPGVVSPPLILPRRNMDSRSNRHSS